MKAIDLVRRSLRLINVPGQGGILSDPVISQAYEALVELTDSESVSKLFTPGIRTHFYSLTPGKSVYSYGPDASCDFRSNDFDDDTAPIRIESAYIRRGGQIVNNEHMTDYRMENPNEWAFSGTGEIYNGQGHLDGAGLISGISPTMIGGNTYRITFDIDVHQGSVKFSLSGTSGEIFTIDIDATGEYTFDLLYSSITGSASLTFTATADDKVSINYVSSMEIDKQRLELTAGTGIDYQVKMIDQKRYNQIASKGIGGQPYRMLYDREYEKSYVYFEHTPEAGDILVMDVLVNSVTPTRLHSVIRAQPEAIKWLRYKLADDLAGEFGKSLSPRQITIMNEAWERLASGNRRINRLRVDAALRQRPTFNINQGDE